MRSKRGRKAQRGFSVMLALVIVALAVGSLAVTFLSTFGTKARSERVTEAALAKAKEALIAYAAADINRPGELPCPDVNNDGQLGLGVDFGGGGACTAYIGRLPWAISQLGSGDLRDGNGEGLWYALSKNYRAGGTVPLNSDTPGQLSVTGITPASNVVAIVFAPGDALPGQDRTNKNSAIGYLEGVNAVSNADTTTTFTTENASTTFNDRLITIRPAEIFRLVEKRVARVLRPVLNQYFADWGRYPFAATFTNPTSSDFKGVAPTQTGLLPLTTDSTFITWNTGDSTVDVSGGITLNGPASCAVVPGNILDCSVPILVALLGQTVTVSAVANNVGNAFLVDPVLESNVQYSGLTGVPAQFNRSLNVAGQGVIRAVGTTPGLVLLSMVHIKVPLPTLNASLIPAWITANNWARVTYYGASPAMAPAGGGSCTAAVDPCITTPPAPTTDGCLSICNRSSAIVSNNVNALIIMTGGALAGQTRPSSTLSDYLDADSNPYGNPSVLDLIYENKLFTTTFNDQPFVLTP
jgi:hypothetical protein